jgi:hypothetical protein
MKKLKAKFRKKTELPKIKKKKRIGRWCQYYEGRLPFPIECSTNKSIPITKIFKGGKSFVLKARPLCKTCKRNPSFISWKEGRWDSIINAIKNGKDLSNMPAPDREE